MKPFLSPPVDPLDTPRNRVRAELKPEWLTVRELMLWSGESRATVDNTIQQDMRKGLVEAELPLRGGRRLGRVLQRYRALAQRGMR